uniref:FAM86 N-terminal domain-containing protein n=1 Tax=Ciona intestinalis TaxID=7719 RepID=F6TPM4_CIOIN
MDGVCHISTQFLSCVPIKSFVWRKKYMVKDGRCEIHDIDHLQWSEDCQMKVLNKTCFHEIGKRFPPSKKYQQYFLKFLISKVEENNQPCCDQLCELYVATLQDQTCQQVYKSYYVPSANAYATLEESLSFISNGTTGLVTWTAALLLAEWCLSKQDFLRGKKIIELGSGIGFTGIVLLKAVEQLSYTFTDVHPNVLSVLKSNVAINSLENENVAIKQLKWGEQSTILEQPYDIVLAADVVFDPSIIPDLLHTISMLLCRNKDAILVLVSVVRAEKTFQCFLDGLDNIKGLVYEELVNEQTPEVFYFDRNCQWKILVAKSKQCLTSFK